MVLDGCRGGHDGFVAVFVSSHCGVEWFWVVVGGVMTVSSLFLFGPILVLNGFEWFWGGP